MTSYTHRRQRQRLTALLGVLTLILAACAGDAGTTTTSSQQEVTTTAGQEPATTSAAATTSTSGETATTTANVAQQIVDEASAPITEWAGPEMSPPILGDITVGVVMCAEFIEGCSRQSDGVEEAADILGWNVIRLDGQVNPAVQLEAVNSLINQNVDAIILNSIFAGTIGDAMDNAQAAGIPVITSFSGDPTPFGGLMDINIDNIAAGRAAGAYMVTQGGGGVAIFDHNDSPHVALRAEGLRSALEELAPNGYEIVFDEFIPGASIGPPLEDQASAMLQANPQGTIDWVFAGFDAILTSVVRAIDRAGRDEIRGIAYDANLENLNFIREGRVQVASIGYPLEWTGWALVDELNRHLQGEPTNESYIAFRLITKDNLPPEGQTWQGDFDFRSKYQEIWGR